MCLFPKRIRNPKKDFRSGYDPEWLTVPCGNCYDCIQKNIRDWSARARAEYHDYKEKGGCVLFPTLTYNEKCCPCVNIGNKSYRAFSKRDVQHFIKKFRVYVSRTYGKEFARGIKYMIASEFGTSSGKTHRPHYHCLLFLPWRPKIRKISSIIRKSWRFGYMSWSKKHGAVINSVKGISYVCKYMCKQSNWYHFTGDVPRYIYKGDDRYCNPDFEKLSKVKPFHLQSIGFGLCLNKYVDTSEIIDFRFHFPKDSAVPDDSCYYTIPQYNLHYLIQDKIDGEWSYKNKTYDFMQKVFDFKVRCNWYHLACQLDKDLLNSCGISEFNKKIDNIFDETSLNYREIANFMVSYFGTNYFPPIDFYCDLGSSFRHWYMRYLDFDSDSRRAKSDCVTYEYKKNTPLCYVSLLLDSIRLSVENYVKGTTDLKRHKFASRKKVIDYNSNFS
ncbi:replication initiator protein [Capybara microvirus Cap3_SP_344]|nr:replication initiator protein [Capybara microvirus Cap3_SP_344]